MKTSLADLTMLDHKVLDLEEEAKKKLEESRFSLHNIKNNEALVIHIDNFKSQTYKMVPEKNFATIWVRLQLGLVEQPCT